MHDKLDVVLIFNTKSLFYRMYDKLSRPVIANEVKQSRVTSYELRVTSYELRVTSYELRVTSYGLQVTFRYAILKNADMLRT